MWEWVSEWLSVCMCVHESDSLNTCVSEWVRDCFSGFDYVCERIWVTHTHTCTHIHSTDHSHIHPHTIFLRHSRRRFSFLTTTTLHHSTVRLWGWSLLRSLSLLWFRFRGFGLSVCFTEFGVAAGWVAGRWLCVCVCVCVCSLYLYLSLSLSHTDAFKQQIYTCDSTHLSTHYISVFFPIRLRLLTDRLRFGFFSIRSLLLWLLSLWWVAAAVCGVIIQWIVCVRVSFAYT